MLSDYLHPQEIVISVQCLYCRRCDLNQIVRPDPHVYQIVDPYTLCLHCGSLSALIYARLMPWQTCKLSISCITETSNRRQGNFGSGNWPGFGNRPSVHCGDGASTCACHLGHFQHPDDHLRPAGSLLPQLLVHLHPLHLEVRPIRLHPIPLTSAPSARLLSFGND